MAQDKSEYNTPLRAAAPLLEAAPAVATRRHARGRGDAAAGETILVSEKPEEVKLSLPTLSYQHQRISEDPQRVIGAG
jgi:hypothetical protein